MRWLKKKLTWFLLGGIALAAPLALNSPDQQTKELKFYRAYQGPLFNTASGRLEPGTYYIDGDKVHYMLSEPGVKSIGTQPLGQINLTGMTEVSKLQDKASFIEYVDPDTGEITAELYDNAKYDTLTKPGAVQPTTTKTTTVTPK